MNTNVPNISQDYSPSVYKLEYAFSTYFDINIKYFSDAK